MNVTLVEPSLFWPPSWLLPWHLTLTGMVISLALTLFARARLERAKEEWANAFFYSPSQKAARRLKRKQWQERMWAFLALTILLLILSLMLYLQPRG